jgi:succinate dehydrogenase/fumarate reductase flavoprotein subunit
VEVRKIVTDVLVIGSEGAGARAAISVCEADPKARVTLTTKGRFAKSGATLTAGTDIDVDSTSIIELFGLEGDRRDTKDTFLEDIVEEGRYVNNQKLVEVLVENAPRVVKEVADWGMKVMGLARAAGHKYPRGILSTGVEVMRGLRNKVRQFGDRVSLIEDIMVTDLIKDDAGYVSGATALDLRTGEPVLFVCKAVILATGGGLRIYPWTSGPEELTGDGQAMAYRAGARFTDMEFVQFLTCTLAAPPSKVRSVNPFQLYGGWLLNREGQRFMARWDPERMEQTTRDNLAIGIMTEVLEGRGWKDEKGGYVLISLKHLPDQIIDDSPAIQSWFKKDYIDSVKSATAVKAFPACHFWCGGIVKNERCETSIPGLLGAGEVCGGVHGANRLSGNAVTEILVDGAISGLAAAELIKGRDVPHLSEASYAGLIEKILAPMNRKEGSCPIELRKRIQKLAGYKVGVVRDAEMLEQAIDELQELKEEAAITKVSNPQKVYNREWVEALQVENMALSLEMVARSALERQESRGTHYRRDYPQTDNKSWLKNTFLVKDAEGEMVVTTAPSVMTKVRPEED